MRDETPGGQTAFDTQMPDGEHWGWHLTDANGALQGIIAFNSVLICIDSHGGPCCTWKYCFGRRQAGHISMSLWRKVCWTAFIKLLHRGVHCIAISPAWRHIIASHEVYFGILVDAGKQLDIAWQGGNLNIIRIQEF